MQHKAFPYTVNPEHIPTAKVVDITPSAGCEVRIRYACPDSCWRSHLEAWSRAYGSGNKAAPEPMPYGHCMFKNPVAYGCIPYGCTDQAMIRAAWEVDVRSALGAGWDRNVPKDRLDAIVQATVEARMHGQDIGCAHFLACLAV